MIFFSASIQTEALLQTRNFSEYVLTDSRKHILDCNLQVSRSRFSVLLEHLNFLADRENITTKQLVAIAPQLVSNDSHDRQTSNVCKEIVDKGSYSDVPDIP